MRSIGLVTIVHCHIDYLTGHSLVPPGLRSAAERVRRHQLGHASRRRRFRLCELIRASKDRNAA